MSDLKEILGRAILVIQYRNGDIDTEDGSFATTCTDEMIHLEQALADMFNDDGDDASMDECWENVEKFCSDFEQQAATIKQLEADKEKLEKKVSKQLRTIANFSLSKYVGIEDTVADLEARCKELEDKLFSLGAMNSSPCFCCGYNGKGYYQPDTHSCATRHHKLTQQD